MEDSSTESSFINLYWAAKVMRASSFLFLRCSGGRNGGGRVKTRGLPDRVGVNYRRALQNQEESVWSSRLDKAFGAGDGVFYERLLSTDGDQLILSRFGAAVPWFAEERNDRLGLRR